MGKTARRKNLFRFEFSVGWESLSMHISVSPKLILIAGSLSSAISVILKALGLK